MAKSKVNNLGELLRQSMGSDIDILNEETALLTAPGEHYGSVMLALKAKIKRKTTGKEEDLNLVAKLIPANEMLRIAFDIPVTFKKEVLAYTETIPALVQLQADYQNLFPKCYGARLNMDKNKIQVDENAVIIIENLNVQGFITEDRLVGFDLSATRVILQNLARFHAVPIALKLLKPEVFREKVLPCLVLNKGFEQLAPEVSLAFHNSIMEGARSMKELEPYLDRIQKIVDDDAASQEVDRETFNKPWGTICHTDFWVSNTMIRKNYQGQTVDNKIVDLQLMRYWSCCSDLLFFLFTSVKNNVLDEHYDEFIKLYHQTLVDTLASFEIDLKKFSFEKFLDELNEVAPSELYHILVMLKPICTERGKVTNSSEMFQDSDWSRKDLLGPNHRRKIKDTVLSLIKQGLL